MDNQSLNQMLNENTNLNSEKSISTNINIPIPLQMIIQNYQTMLNTINSPSNQSGVVQANVVNRVGTLYKLFLDFLLPIISGLIDFMKAFISKSEEQDKKIDIQKKNLDIQARNLRVIGAIIDDVKTDLKNTKIQFDSSMKAYHENITKLAEKLKQLYGQNINKPMSEAAKAMFAGNKTKKHRKYRRKISK
jgi:hypothetical protein